MLAASTEAASDDRDSQTVKVIRRWGPTERKRGGKWSKTGTRGLPLGSSVPSPASAALVSLLAASCTQHLMPGPECHNNTKVRVFACRIIEDHYRAQQSMLWRILGG